jgi:hypothetical protein
VKWVEGVFSNNWGWVQILFSLFFWKVKGMLSRFFSFFQMRVWPRLVTILGGQGFGGKKRVGGG